MTQHKKNKKSIIYNNRLLAIILITAISTMVYVNTLRNGFTYDDRKVVVKNKEIKDMNKFFDVLLPLPYLGMDEILKRSGLRLREREYALISILGRLTGMISEHQSQLWLEKYAFFDILGYFMGIMDFKS